MQRTSYNRHQSADRVAQRASLLSASPLGRARAMASYTPTPRSPAQPPKPHATPTAPAQTMLTPRSARIGASPGLVVANAIAQGSPSLGAGHQVPAGLASPSSAIGAMHRQQGALQQTVELGLCGSSFWVVRLVTLRPTSF